MNERMLVVFGGVELLARGEVEAVIEAAKQWHDADRPGRLAVYDDETGRPLDVDYRGSASEVVARVIAGANAVEPPDPPPPRRRGPGRPRLGVVSREVSLLPRHWDWLKEQRGGASATLRRLVDAARKAESGASVARRAVDAAHRFMWDLAGDQPGFEEASRALFAHDFDTFEARVGDWPTGIHAQLGRFVGRARAAL
jgi:uncharacterized protein